MKKLFIETLGCQMNKSDSERIAGILSHFDYVEMASCMIFKYES